MWLTNQSASTAICAWERQILLASRERRSFAGAAYAVPPGMAAFPGNALDTGASIAQTTSATNTSATNNVSRLHCWLHSGGVTASHGRLTEYSTLPTTIRNSVTSSIAQMHASRDAVRHAIATLRDEPTADEGMSRRVFIPLVGCGWVTARMALQSCLVHTWAHFTEARLRLKQSAPVPNPAITHAGLSFFMGMMPMMINAEQATRTTLTAGLEVGGAGGGHWTVRVGDGTCTVAEARMAQNDLIMRYRDAETFITVMRGMQNPMRAILAGKIKIQGFQKMGLFGKLFAEPKPNQILRPIAA